MPRLTRGTLASKKEEKVEVAQPAKSGGRGAKRGKPEPVEEALPIKEPQPSPSKAARASRGKDAAPKEEAPKAAASRGRSRGKKEDEPEEKSAPPKRGGRGKKEEVAEEESETPPPKRTGRGGRGKKQEEEAEEIEEEEEEETEKPAPSKRGGRGKKDVVEEEKEEAPPKKAARGGRGKKQEPEEEKEPAPPKRAARGGRGKKQEEPIEEEEEKEEETLPTPPKRGGRGGRWKKEEVEEEEAKPAPKKAVRGGRGSRGKKTEEEVEEEADEAKEEPAVKSESPKGRKGQTPTKSETPSAEPGEEPAVIAESPRSRKSRAPSKPEAVTPTPSSGGRRSGGRGKADEAITTPSPSKKESDASIPLAEEEKEEKLDVPQQKVTEKPEEGKDETNTQAEKDGEMEVEENEPEAVTNNEDKEETKPAVVPQSTEKEEEMDEVVENDSSGRKRKHEEDDEEEESSSKKARVFETPVKAPVEEEPMAEEEDDATDFVLVNKEDVPPADSEEVEAALPPPVEEESEDLPEKVQSTESETVEAAVEQIETEPPAPLAMAAPIVVPLTEAEIGKQYNPTIMDRDENSSTMVEVGSEAASDIGNMSRNLDMTEVTSMDAASIADESNLSAVSSESASEVSSSKPPPDLPSEPVPLEESSPEVAAPTPTTPVMEVSQTANAGISPIPLPSQQSQSPVKSQTDQTPPSQISAQAPPPVPVTASQATVPALVPVTPPQAPATQNTVPQLQLNSIPLPPDMNMSNSSPHDGPLPTQPPAAHNSTNQNGSYKPVEKVPQSSPIVHMSSPPAKKSPVVLDSNYVPSSPSIVKRKFISNPSFPVELMDPAFCFSVVSYNILADCHLRRYNYSYTEPQYLEQSYRHSLFLKELDYLDGDIVCLQEVDTAYFHNTLLPAMTTRGYQGVYKKRTADWYDEGEATFVKTSKFEILSYQGLSLKDLAYEEVEAAGLSGDVARAAKKYLDRADVVLVCKLLSKKTGKHLTVGNIHVLFDPKAPDVQCIQTASAINYVVVASAVKELVSQAGSDLNPYIICGDFNSETSSPAYQLAKDGYLSDAHIRNLQSIQSMDNTEGSSRSIIHYMWKAFQHTSSNMKSAYETTVGKEPVITSLNGLVKACLDYVFYSSSTLYTVGALEVLDPQVVEVTGGLPSKDIPSDHLSVKAVFRLKD